MMFRHVRSFAVVLGAHLLAVAALGQTADVPSRDPRPGPDPTTSTATELLWQFETGG